MGCMGERLLEIPRCSRLLVPATPEKRLPQLTGERRSVLLQTRGYVPHGHTPTSCGSWSRVTLQNLGPNLHAIASGRQGTSESSHPHRELLFARTRWAEHGVEVGVGGRHEHMRSRWASHCKAKPCPQRVAQVTAFCLPPQRRGGVMLGDAPRDGRLCQGTGQLRVRAACRQCGISGLHHEPQPEPNAQTVP